jgi:hypothetical protein
MAEYLLGEEGNRERSDLALGVNRTSPEAVRAAAELLQIPGDKLRVLLVWDREFHQELWDIWHPPPTTSDEYKAANHKVRISRERLDQKEAELLGQDLANQYNAQYSAAMNRLYFQRDHGPTPTQADGGTS